MVTNNKSKNRLIALLVVMVLVFSILPVGAMAAVPTYNGVEIQFGDPTKTATWPESDMTITASGNSLTASYTGSNSANYQPDVLSLYVYYALNNSAITLSGDSNIKFATYDQNGSETLHSSITYSQNGNASLYTVKLTGAGTITITGAEDTITILLPAPQSGAVAGGTTPAAVNGYLPIGQYSRGTAWGALFTNGYNYDSTIAKMTTGYSATGVSLGLLGGYVQFDMGAGNSIANDPTNPYGVDFIVYGNAFSGNPEAASVMVSQDGETWYNLAGSLHYDENTKWNVNVSYIKIATANTTIGGKTFAAAGIYYSNDFVTPAEDASSAVVDAAIGAATWNVSNTGSVFNAAWFPDYGYVSTARPGTYGSVFRRDNHIGSNVVWNTTGTAEVITYKGLTQVKDDAEIGGLSGANATNYYAWGYADVRANGTSYGNAVNPYATLPAAASGGDGFDLSWAVNASGEPVSLSSVRFVRVYSAVLYNAGVFGETSAEVCGLFVASGTNSSTTATTKATITTSSGTVSDVRVSATQRLVTVTVPSGSNSTTITATNTAGMILIDDAVASSGGTVTLSKTNGSTQYFRVITQDGTQQASISVVKVVFE